MTGACWASWRFTWDGSSSHSTLDPPLGARVESEGEHVRGGLDTGPMIGGLKWTGAKRQEHAEPHGQFTGRDEFITHFYLNCGPRGRHRGRQHARTILVMAWRYWTVCRSSRIDLPGPHYEVLSEPPAGHVLVAFFRSSTAAYVLLSDNHKNSIWICM
jgi:hypothetical protein